MLIKKVFEIDPMACPQCGGEMKLISFIDPPQEVVIETILKPCGLWKAPAPRGPPDTNDLGHDLMDYESMEQMPQLTYVDMDTFQATF